MTVLLKIRDQLRSFYANYDVYLRPVLKFLFAFCCLFSVNRYLGYFALFNKIEMVLLGALICALTPMGMSAFVSAAFAAAHVFEICMPAAAILLALLLLITGLYLGLRPQGAVILALVPLSFLWNVPFLMPVVLGLAAGLAAVVPSVCAIPVWFLMRYVHENAPSLQNTTDLNKLAQDFAAVGEGVFKDRYLYLMILMFVAVILAVSLVKQLSVDHAWTIAVAAGILLELAIGVIGAHSLGAGNMTADLAGVLASAVLAFLYECIFYAVDYSGTEKLQFEDDDYYYYVKAVPKIRPLDEDGRKE